MASKIATALQNDRIEQAQAEFHASVNDRLQSLEEKIDQLIALLITSTYSDGVLESEDHDRNTESTLNRRGRKPAVKD